MDTRTDWLRTRRLVAATLVGFVALGLCLAAATAQAASPGWKMLAVTGPTNLPPKQSEVQRISVEAEGGTFTILGEAPEGIGTPVVTEGTLDLTEGSAVATIASVGSGASFEVGNRVTGFGLPFYPSETTVVSCSTDCQTPGSTVTLSNQANANVSGSAIEIFTKELSSVTGEFHVGEEIQGVQYEYFPADTVVTAVGSETLTLSKPTSYEYFTGEGAIAIAGSLAESDPIPYDGSADELESAIEGVPAWGPDSVTVTGGPGGTGDTPYFVTFTGPLAYQDVDKLQISDDGLEGEHPGIHLLTTVPGGAGTGIVAAVPTNVGGLPTEGLITVELGPLPAGVVTSGEATGVGWECPAGAGSSMVVCTSEEAIPASTPGWAITVPLEVEPTVTSSAEVPVTVSGGGGGSSTYQMPVVVSAQPASFGAAGFWAGAFDANGNPETQAGGHAYTAQSFFLSKTVRSTTGNLIPAGGDSKNVIVDLPPGFVGNPFVTKRCPQDVLVPPGFGGSGAGLCTDEMKVGRFEPVLGALNGSASFVTPIYNDVPANGYAAEFTTVVALPIQSLLASVRGDDDYGIRITAPNNPTFSRVYGSYASLEGMPEASNGKAFFGNPTDCAEEARRSPVVLTRASTWQEPDNYSSDFPQVLPPVTGCDKLEFHPSFGFQPTDTQGSSGTGATAHLHIPQDGLEDPNQLRTPDLKKAVVTLPEGLVLNPASANGLASCSEDQIGYRGSDFPLPNPIRFDEAAPSCPDASKLGTVEIDTPLLENKLGGTIYLAAQDENPFNSLIAIYLVVDDARTGVTLKLPGKVEPDPGTGQLTATFDYNPQLPFEDLTLHFRGGGPRSELATPEVCGHHNTHGVLTPWSAPESGPPAQTDDGFDIGTGCSPSANTRPFAPSFEAGSVTPLAGAYSPLVIKLGRQDGEQEISNLNFTLPEGLTGKLAGVPYCPDGAIALAAGKSGKDEQAAPSCPAASALGSVDTSAGVGSEPIHVGGSVYLAGPYKGAPISAVVITPAVAGPFDLGNVVVRAPLFVNPETAQIEARSDAIPTILKGLPLKVRSIALKIDRPGFSLNPTSCDAMPVLASVGSSDGATATPSNRFQVGGCNKLGFKPRLSLRLKGGTRRAKNPKLIATLKQPAGQANIGRVSVALPHSEFLDNSHIRTVCTRVQFAAEQCPKGSIYGHAEAVSPLLAEPLKGPVYLRSSNHKLPDLVVALRGPAYQPVEIDLAGRIDSIRGGIRNSFELVPDAPVSKFVLRMQGGKKGLLVNSTNICRGTHRATVKMIGQNNKRADLRPELKAQCKKHRKGSRHHGKR